MKTLLLMRHAKSSWDDPGLDDHDRPLNRRGLRDAPRIAAWLMQQGRTPDSVTCSTAVRAEHTARIVHDVCHVAAPLEVAPELYHADLDAWQRVIRGLPQDSRTALCVGHNPGIEALVAWLTGEARHMPTAAVAVLELRISDWRQFPDGKPVREWTLWRPKDLPDALPGDSAD